MRMCTTRMHADAERMHPTPCALSVLAVAAMYLVMAVA
jgi:hypothetical protein